MEITKHHESNDVLLQVSGRLDAYWADHLASAIEESLQAGGHRLRLDMQQVAYMSSAGIRILLRFRKQLHGLGGSFVVVNPSASVRSVIEMVGLEAIFAEPQAAKVVAVEEIRRFESNGLTLEVHGAVPADPAPIRLIGDPSSLLSRDSVAGECLRLEGSSMALGVGALGGEESASRGSFGELLALAGGAAYQPADGTGAPDYLVATGALQPTAQVLYAATCEMSGSTLVRFEGQGAVEVVTLSSLSRACLDLSNSSMAAVAIIAETAGLMGAALRRPPASGEDGLSFALPEVRTWFSFTPERVHTRSLSLTVGIIAREPNLLWKSFVRPVSTGTELYGHFHSAAFPYRPLRKGKVDLAETVAGLFENGGPLAILHLLNDDRPIVGNGESLFIRGACWVQPLSENGRGVGK